MSGIRRSVSVLLALMIMFTAASCGIEAGLRDEPVREVSGSPIQQGSETGSESGIFPAKDNYLTDSKWGYIDKAGMFVIQPSFTQAFRFQGNGRAVAGRDDKVGLIDRTGSYITEPVFSYINEFKEGLAIAADNSGYVVLDTNGKVISEKYQYIGDYSGGRAAFSIQAQDGSLHYGYLDETGKPVIKPGYLYATNFEGELAVVKLADGVHEIIDRMGKTVKALDFWQVAGLSDGKAAFRQSPDEKLGYIDINGNVIIKPAFTTAGNFVDGRAVVTVPRGDGFEIRGLIDESGQFVYEPQYNEIIIPGEKRAALGLPRDPNNPFAGSKYALADYDGKLLTDFDFYDIGKYDNGIAYAVDSSSTYFIDKSGNRVESLPSAEGAGQMEVLDGLVSASIDQRMYYIDKQGTIVYKPLSCIDTDTGLKVCEEKFRPNTDYIVYYPVLENMADMKKELEVNRELKEMWTGISTLSIKPDDVLDYHYEGGFSIAYGRKSLLVIMESGYDYPFGAAHGMPLMNHVHIDTRTGEFYELEDLFLKDSDYTGILSEIVRSQITDMSGTESEMYWLDSYEGISSDQLFYITDKGLNLYFTPYEIAPYAAGFPTFMVTFEEIGDIIDKKGGFWKSFN